MQKSEPLIDPKTTYYDEDFGIDEMNILWVGMRNKQNLGAEGLMRQLNTDDKAITECRYTNDCFGFTRQIGV